MVTDAVVLAFSWGPKESLPLSMTQVVLRDMTFLFFFFPFIFISWRLVTTQHFSGLTWLF